MWIHVTSGLGLGWGLGYGKVGPRQTRQNTRHGWMCVSWPLFNSNNFVISAALAEVCALLSAILVVTIIIFIK